MLTIFLLCALFALSDATGAEELGDGVESRSRCSSGWTQYGSRCFIFISSSRTWPEAERYCLHFGANLASVHSFEEYHYIQEIVRRNTGGFPRTWIGGTDTAQDRLWFWSDGSRFDIQLWNRGEPNNAGGREYCVEMNSGGESHWNDHDCRTQLPFVCAMKLNC
uniref:ladderlectin-like n=1 Tax=Centroberyx gerrardi TaxID=166262 RepID=UPI003AAE62F3